MKNIIASLIFVAGIFSFSSCDEILDNIPLTDTQIVDGLKEALRVGSDTAVYQGNKYDGYFGNALIKILLPPEADPIIDLIGQTSIGQQYLNDVVLKMNRAAEQAAIEATPILIDAITGMTISDGITILNGADDAATQYLKGNTQPQINQAFRPYVLDALESVGAQSAWGTLTSYYNPIATIAGQPQVNTDLTDYTTTRATDGLFVLVGQEEMKIRTEVSHQVNDILQSVFGN